MIKSKPSLSKLFFFAAGLGCNSASMADIGRECKDQNSKIFGLFFDSTATQACVDRKLAEERMMIDQQYSQHNRNQGALADADFRASMSKLDGMKQGFEANHLIQKGSLPEVSNETATISAPSEKDRLTLETVPGFKIKGILE